MRPAISGVFFVVLLYKLFLTSMKNIVGIPYSIHQQNIIYRKEDEQQIF